MSENQIMKLQYNGKSYRVTIPSDLIRKSGWIKGDCIQVKPDQGEITLSKIINDNEPVIYSIGYEGINQNEFMNILISNHIQQLIDVRQIPNSRKKGFAKNSLMEELKKYRIDYTHIPELGTDKTSRDNYRTNKNIKKLLKEYEQRFKANYSSFELLKALANYRTSAIMCFEKEHQLCHRQRITSELAEEGFKVIHLCNGKQKRFL